MKKSLIALAVLAASGAAMAQSSVTLYGIADVYLGSNKTGVNNATVRNTVVDSQTLNGSRWGLKGTEDLGGGLKAIFQLESGFDISTGASQQGGALFGRQAYVGFSGGFGSVVAGRTYSPYDDVHGVLTPNHDATVNSMAAVAGWGALADYTPRINNAIKYQSPDFGGITGSVLLGLGEDKTTALSASRTTALNVKYAAGPILAAAAFQQEKPQGAGDKTSFTMLGGGYNLGVVNLRAVLENAKKGDLKDRGYTLGAEAPVGSAATVSFGYSKSKGQVAGTTTHKDTGYSLLGKYNLSTRTAVYAGWNNITEENDAGVDLKKTSTYRVGVRHMF